MNTTVQQLQRRLIALGFPMPKFGADGDPGEELWTATQKALDEIEALRGSTAIPAPTVALAAKPAGKSIVPADWMPTVKMERIICHWTAGTHKATDYDWSNHRGLAMLSVKVYGS